MSLFINKISEFLFLVIFQLTNVRIILCFLPEANNFFLKNGLMSVVGNLDFVFPFVKVAAKEV